MSALTRWQRLGLTIRTARHLRPAQLIDRPRLRLQRRAITIAPQSLGLGGTERSVKGWPDSFHPVDESLPVGFPSAEDNAKGVFEFLGRRLELGDPIDWAAPEASQLWKFHLHYFEWLWSLAQHADRKWARATFVHLWSTWKRASPIGRGDAWSPYVASLRAWALCSVWTELIADSEAEASVRDSLTTHARYIRVLRERDVGGNHLLKNLKALIGLGVFFGDDGLVDHGSRWLHRELSVQILADGGHFERSPSYHCQVLGDLIDIEHLLAAADMPPVAGLAEPIARMRAWLGAMLLPDGDVPLFNDCTLVGHARIAALRPTPPAQEAVTTLEPSGYVIVRGVGPWHVVMDVGPPCPTDLPAHAHADALSLEIAADGRRVVVNSGTSTYDAGPRRNYERSTAAHNTVEVDRTSQSEVWDRFRVGRKANVFDLRVDPIEGEVRISAAHDGYRRLAAPVVHRREVLVKEGSIRVVDRVEGSGSHEVRARWHASPNEAASAQPVRLGPLDATITTTPSSHDLSLEPALVSTAFGELLPSSVMITTVTSPTPIEIRTEFRHRLP